MEYINTLRPHFSAKNYLDINSKFRSATEIEVLRSSNYHYKILAVEDDLVCGKVLFYLLKTAGYTSDLVETGQAAYEKYKSCAYDLILTDVGMPDMDGIELTKLIRKYDSRIPIVGQTAFGDETTPRCYEAGMNNLLFKPLVSKKLEHTLANFLALKNHATR